jgi:hypothetical protein
LCRRLMKLTRRTERIGGPELLANGCRLWK